MEPIVERFLGCLGPDAALDLADEENNEAVGLGGKLRKSNDKRKNIRDAFRNAVNRAIKYLEKYDKPLAAHLKESIKCGNEPVYRTEEEIVWEVRPIVND